MVDNTDRWFVNLKKRRSRGRHHYLRRRMLKYWVQLKFPATNNEVEYEGILTGLRVKKALRAKNLFL